jgi:serine/threonine protein kinase
MNILLTHDFPRAEWKPGDFGQSKETDMTGTFCGTLLYLSPEIDGLVGSVYTNAVDVWSVGVVGLQYSCGFNPRDLRKTRIRQDHKAWTEAVARRAKSKISVLSESPPRCWI